MQHGSKRVRSGMCWWVALCVAVGGSWAEKKLIYDEERGIITIDTDQPSLRPEEKPSRKPPRARKPQPIVDEDIHVNRPRDAAHVYFQSGLEYFRNGDYENALKYFSHIDSLDPRPEYALWHGKTLRQLKRFGKMSSVMKSIIAAYPSSDVADDALFELAFYAQTSNDYATADSLYKQLAEQYPFGKSFSNNQPFHEIARQQRRAMHDETAEALKTLGFWETDLSTSCAAFQKSARLPVSGRADAATVGALKTEYQKIIDRNNNEKAWIRHQRGYTIAAIAMLAVSTLTLAIIVTMLVSIRDKSRQLAMMRQLIADLDVRKIRQGSPDVGRP